MSPLLLGILLLSLLPHIQGASDYFVCDSGSDQNNGTSRSFPFASLPKAFASCAASGVSSCRVYALSNLTVHASSNVPGAATSVSLDCLFHTLTFSSGSAVQVAQSASLNISQCTLLGIGPALTAAPNSSAAITDSLVSLRSFTAVTLGLRTLAMFSNVTFVVPSLLASSANPLHVFADASSHIAFDGCEFLGGGPLIPVPSVVVSLGSVSLMNSAVHLHAFQNADSAFWLNGSSALLEFRHVSFSSNVVSDSSCLVSVGVNATLSATHVSLNDFSSFGTGSAFCFPFFSSGTFSDFSIMDGRSGILGILSINPNSMIEITNFSASSCVGPSTSLLSIQSSFKMSNFSVMHFGNSFASVPTSALFRFHYPRLPRNWTLSISNGTLEDLFVQHTVFGIYVSGSALASLDNTIFFSSVLASQLIIVSNYSGLAPEDASFFTCQSDSPLTVLIRQINVWSVSFVSWKRMQVLVSRGSVLLISRMTLGLPLDAGLTHVRIENSTVGSTQGGYLGSALLFSGSLEVLGCSFDSCLSFSGGAIAGDASPFVSIRSSSFLYNTAYANGGAIWMGSSVGAFELFASSFSNNGVTSGRGGTVYLDDAYIASGSSYPFRVDSVQMDSSFCNALPFASPVPLSSQFCEGVGMYVGSGHVVRISKSTFSNCQGNGAVGFGGALYVSESDVFISNSSFVANSPSSGSATGFVQSVSMGGAIFCDFNSFLFLLEGCVFSSNNAGSFVGAAAGGLGGAVATRGEVVVSSVMFFGNTAARGGALYVLAGSVSTVIVDSQFVGNCAVDEGGAAFFDLFTQQATLENCTFDGNFGCTAAPVQLRGGAIFSASVNLAVSSTTFRNPFDVSEGGAIYTGPNLQLLNSEFVNNTAAQNGGALLIDSSLYPPSYSDNSGFLANNVLFSNNSAILGGGGVLFIANIAQVSDAGVYFTMRPALLRMLSLSDFLRSLGNAASYGPSIGSPLFYFQITKVNGIPVTESQNASVSLTAGQTFSVEFSFYDMFDQIIAGPEDDTVVYLYCTSQRTFLKPQWNVLNFNTSTFLQEYTSIDPSQVGSCAFEGDSRSLSKNGIARFTGLSAQYPQSHAPSIFIFAATSAEVVESLVSDDSFVFSPWPLNLTFMPCDPGFRLSNRLCLHCPSGEYSLLSDSQQCFSCSEIQKGNRAQCSPDGDAIIARPGYFAVATQSGFTDLLLCPVESFCTGVGGFASASDVSTVSYLPRYSSDIVYDIPAGSLLLPGEVRTQCQTGHMGFLCGECLDHWSFWGRNCVNCETRSLEVIAGYIFGGLFYVVFTHYVSQSAGSEFKIIMSFIQMSALLVISSSELSIALFELRTGTLCPFYRTFVGVFWTNLIIPFLLFVVLGCLFLLFLLIRLTGFHEQIAIRSIRILFRVRAFLRTSILLGLTIFPALSNTAFEFLDCQPYPVVSKSVVYSYPGFDCRSTDYRKYVQPFALVLIIFCGCIPFVVAAYLFVLKKRGRIFLGADISTSDVRVNRSTYTLGPLFESYRDRYWYYESFLLIRRFSFMGVPILFFSMFPNDIRVALTARIAICFLFLTVHVKMAPFREALDNHLETVSLYGTLALSVLSTLDAISVESATADASNRYRFYLVLFFIVFSAVLAYVLIVVGLEFFKTTKQKKLMLRQTESDGTPVTWRDSAHANRPTRPIFSTRRVRKQAVMELPLLDSPSSSL
eukprot:ANDGO_05006.mRNA.1 hypothetical protein